MVLVEQQGQRIVAELAALDRHRLKAADLHLWLREAKPADDIARAAAFIALQASAARGKPIDPLPGGRWRTAGYAHLSDSARAKGFPERLRPLALAARVQAVLGIDWPPVTIIHGDATSVAPAGGRVVIDPPYLDTTGYGAAMSRAAVCSVARRHANAGALVGVCEGEPLGQRPSPMVGWTSTPVQSDGWQRRLGSTAEWLTTSRPPAPCNEDRGVLSLWPLSA